MLQLSHFLYWCRRHLAPFQVSVYTLTPENKSLTFSPQNVAYAEESLFLPHAPPAGDKRQTSF